MQSKIRRSAEQENVQALSVEAAEPMAVEITEQETENATAVMTEEPKAEVDAEEIAEPAFVSVQILEEPLPEILEPVPVEPVKKTVRKKSRKCRRDCTVHSSPLLLQIKGDPCIDSDRKSDNNGIDEILHRKHKGKRRHRIFTDLCHKITVHNVIQCIHCHGYDHGK